MYCNFCISKKILAVFLMSLIFAFSLFMVSGDKYNASLAKTTANQLNTGVSVPIIMYHSVLKDNNMHGDYVISPQKFEDDIKYITDNGYTPVNSEDLIAYVNNGKPLPEKPIVITFDDGYYNNFFYVFPIIKKYNCKIILSPIAYNSDIEKKIIKQSAYYSHCTWQQLKEMTSSGLVELGNHSYNLHESSGERLGTKKLPGETENEYRAFIKEDLSKAQDRFKEELGITPVLFAYPFGAISEESKPVVQDLGFKISLSCEEKISVIKAGDKESLYLLGRYLRANKYTTEQFFSKIKG